MSIYRQNQTLPYCTYITFYRGNKLPPFYIGWSTSGKVLDRTYHGSVLSKKYKEIYDKEKEENKHLFKTIPLTFHESAKEAVDKEEYFLKFFDAKRNSLYINMTNGNGNFYTNGPLSEEHKTKLSAARIGKKHTEETKERISISMAGENHPLFGKQHSEITKKKMSHSKSGKNHPLFGKKLSVGHKMRKKITDGINTFNSISEAGSFHGITKQAVSYRVKSSGFPNWAFL